MVSTCIRRHVVDLERITQCQARPDHCWAENPIRRSWRKSLLLYSGPTRLLTSVQGAVMVWVTGTGKEERFKGKTGEEYHLHSWQVCPCAVSLNILSWTLLLSLQFFFSYAHTLTYPCVGAGLSTHQANVYWVPIMCKELREMRGLGP